MITGKTVLGWIASAVTALAATITMVAPATPVHAAARGGPRGGGDVCCGGYQPGTWIVWPLGDSITEGVTPGGGDGGYRSRLDATWTPAHRWTGTLVDAQGRRHDGHSGWPAMNVRNSLVTWMNAIEPPDLVTVHLGTNDVGRDFNRTGAQVAADMTAIVDAIHIRFPAAVVIVALIPQVPINTPAQQAALSDYNAALPGIAAPRAAWLRLSDHRGDHLSIDNIHPDALGYAQSAAGWSLLLPPGTKLARR